MGQGFRFKANRPTLVLLVLFALSLTFLGRPGFVVCLVLLVTAIAYNLLRGRATRSAVVPLTEDKAGDGGQEEIG